MISIRLKAQGKRQDYVSAYQAVQSIYRCADVLNNIVQFIELPFQGVEAIVEPVGTIRLDAINVVSPILVLECACVVNSVCHGFPPTTGTWQWTTYTEKAYLLPYQLDGRH